MYLRNMACFRYIMVNTLHKGRIMMIMLMIVIIISRYSAVGRATRYGLDDLGITRRWGRDRLRGKSRILYNEYMALPEGKAVGAWC